jgi:hypothetical protein
MAVTSRFIGLCAPGFAIFLNAIFLSNTLSKRLSLKIQQRERLHLL